MSRDKELIREKEAAAIRAAVQEAESQSAGEIVPVLVEAADGHPGAYWKAATFGALAAATAAALVRPLLPGWGTAPLWLALPAALGALLGALAASALPGLRRRLVGDERLDERVDACAAEAFLRHEVFRTRDRSGILILVALFEHRVRILADEGIHAAVPRETWQRVAAEAASEMRRGSPGEALRRAVERCGELLAEHGPKRREDDVNELPDAPVSEPR
ncbi:MAG: TPM domain-containing protein [Holophagales bacterium]|nr:TPM domain-containing protein [Holophagales bacterium]